LIRRRRFVRVLASGGVDAGRLSRGMCTRHRTVPGAKMGRSASAHPRFSTHYRELKFCRLLDPRIQALILLYTAPSMRHFSFQVGRDFGKQNISASEDEDQGGGQKGAGGEEGDDAQEGGKKDSDGEEEGRRQEGREEKDVDQEGRREARGAQDGDEEGGQEESKQEKGRR
jgi:hypothetical protein